MLYGCEKRETRDIGAVGPKKGEAEVCAVAREAVWSAKCIQRGVRLTTSPDACCS